MKNKFLVAVLILTLCFTYCFTLTGCGKSGGIEWTLGEDGYEAEYDFGAENSDAGALRAILEKMDYSDLGALQEELQGKTETAINELSLGNFELFTDYEEMEETMEEAQEEGYDVGNLVYCTGMEDDDMDKAAIESGVYENPMDGKTYQYVIYSTESYYDSTQVDTAQVCDTISKAFGITLNEQKLADAITAISAKALEPVPEDAEEGDEEGEDAEEIEIEEGEEGEDAEEDVDSEGDEEEIDLEDAEELTEEDLEALGIDIENLEGEDEEGEEGDDEEEIEFEDEDGEYVDVDDLDFAEEGEGEYGYPCAMTQTIEVEGDGYTDKIVLTLVGQQIDAEQVLVYLSTEIDRCYA